MDASSHIVVDETSARYDGWRIVVICFLVATFGWAFGFYGQSVYLAELHRLHGWPASLISSATTFFYLIGAVLVAFVSEAVRAFGPRNCLLGGVVAMAAAAALIGQVTAPWQLYALSVLLAFGWAGTSLGIITNTLGLWFDKKRGMAISLALNGASFGGIAGVPLLVAAIGHFGFPGAMIAAAIAMVVVMVPVILIFVGRQSDHAAGADRAARVRPALVRRTDQPDHRDQPGHLRLRPRRNRPVARRVRELCAAVLRLHRARIDCGRADHGEGATREDLAR